MEETVGSAFLASKSSLNVGDLSFDMGGRAATTTDNHKDSSSIPQNRIDLIGSVGPVTLTDLGMLPNGTDSTIGCIK